MGFEKKSKKKKKRRPKKEEEREEEEEQAEAKPAFEAEPTLQFMWVPEEQHYYIMEQGTPRTDDYRNWMMSRHFLTKLKGVGHWLCEGAIPEQVAMLVQMMRYFRMGYPREKKD